MLGFFNYFLCVGNAAGNGVQIQLELVVLAITLASGFPAACGP